MTKLRDAMPPLFVGFMIVVIILTAWHDGAGWPEAIAAAIAIILILGFA